MISSGTAHPESSKPPRSASPILPPPMIASLRIALLRSPCRDATRSASSDERVCSAADERPDEEANVCRSLGDAAHQVLIPLTPEGDVDPEPEPLIEQPSL